MGGWAIGALPNQLPCCIVPMVNTRKFDASLKIRRAETPHVELPVARSNKTDRLDRQDQRRRQRGADCGRTIARSRRALLASAHHITSHHDYRLAGVDCVSIYSMAAPQQRSSLSACMADGNKCKAGAVCSWNPSTDIGRLAQPGSRRFVSRVSLFHKRAGFAHWGAERSSRLGR